MDPDVDRERRFRSNWGRSVITAAVAYNRSWSRSDWGGKSVVGNRTPTSGSRRGGVETRGRRSIEAAKPAAVRGDAEHVESQRAGGQSVSTDEQVELNR